MLFAPNASQQPFAGSMPAVISANSLADIRRSSLGSLACP
jgi:hypothetical protein